MSQNQKRYRPAKSAGEAWGRWALGGNVGRAQRGELVAYTAQHFDEDEAAGIIIRPVNRASCPSSRPERHCRPRDVPRHYRSVWRQHQVFPARKPTPADPTPRPRRELTCGRVICYDCKLWLDQCDRNAFADEFGDHGLGYVRPTRVADLGEIERTAGERARRDYADVYTIAGEPEHPIDWHDARVLAATVRRCSRRFAMISRAA